MERKELEDLSLSNLRNLYKEKYPSKASLGNRGVTKKYLIEQLSIVELSVIDAITQHYHNEMGEEMFNRIEDALAGLPDMNKFSKLWIDSYIHPWELFNNEMKLIYDDKDTKKLFKKLQSDKYLILIYDSDKHERDTLNDDLLQFVILYPVVVWAYAHTDNKLATLALVSIIDDWKAISKLENNFTTRAYLNAKGKTYADKIFKYLLEKDVPDLIDIDDNYDNSFLIYLASIGDNTNMSIILSKMPKKIPIYEEYMLLSEASNIVAINNNLDGFKLFYPHLSVAALFYIMIYADIDIINYLHKVRPRLEYEGYDGGDKGSDDWDWNVIIEDILKHRSMSRLKAIIAWNPPEYVIDYALELLGEYESKYEKDVEKYDEMEQFLWQSY